MERILYLLRVFHIKRSRSINALVNAVNAVPVQAGQASGRIFTVTFFFLKMQWLLCICISTALSVPRICEQQKKTVKQTFHSKFKKKEVPEGKRSREVFELSIKIATSQSVI